MKRAKLFVLLFMTMLICAIGVSARQLRSKAVQARGCGSHACRTSNDCINAPCPSCSNYDQGNPGLCVYIN